MRESGYNVAESVLYTGLYGAANATGITSITDAYVASDSLTGQQFACPGSFLADGESISETITHGPWTIHGLNKDGIVAQIQFSPGGRLAIGSCRGLEMQD